MFLTIAVPVAILLTMTGTIKKKNKRNKNWRIAGLTTFSSIAVLLIMLSLIMQVSFGGWANEAILYRNKKDKNVSINEQIWDIGAFGYDRRNKRIVKLKPFSNYFYQVTSVDTLKMNMHEWIFVNEEGDIHYP